MVIKIEFNLRDKDNWDFFNDVLLSAKARGFHCNGTDVLHKKAEDPPEPSPLSTETATKGKS